jgi:hypothetical protein
VNQLLVPAVICFDVRDKFCVIEQVTKKFVPVLHANASSPGHAGHLFGGDACKYGSDIILESVDGGD